MQCSDNVVTYINIRYRSIGIRDTKQQNSRLEENKWKK